MDWVFIERTAWSVVHVVVAIWFGWLTLKAVRLGISRYLTGAEERNATEVAAMAQGVAVLVKLEESLRRQSDRMGGVESSCKETEKWMKGRSAQPRMPDLAHTQMDPARMDPPPPGGR